MTRSATGVSTFDVIYGSNFIDVEVVDRLLVGDINMDGVVSLLDEVPIAQLIASGVFLAQGDTSPTLVLTTRLPSRRQVLNNVCGTGCLARGKNRFELSRQYHSCQATYSLKH